MPKIYQPNFLKVNPTIEQQIDLSGVPEADYNNLEMFNGIAITDQLNSHSLRATEGVLQQFVDFFNQGNIGVYTDHWRSYSNRIGKVVKAQMSDGQVEVAFGLVPGIESANSDDIIRIMKNTGGDLSPTYQPAEDGIVCDVCGSIMSSWYGYVWYDDNDHLLGGRYYENDEPLIVTAELRSIVDVLELSIVTNGADPGVEVTGTIAQALQEKIGKDAHLAKTVAQMNNWDYGLFSQSINLKPASTQIPVDGLKDKGVEMSNELLQQLESPDINTMDASALITIVKQCSDKIKEQAETIENMKTEEEYNTVAEALATMKTEVENGNASQDKVEELQNIVKAEREYWIEQAVKNKKKVLACRDDDTRLEQYKESLEGEASVAKIRQSAINNQSTYEAINTASDYLELKSTEDKDTGKVRIPTGA
ncbi:MAG: hypothetical protein OXE50_15580 [Chloroflexi bacterium]|nr:hypothetical protein [Chloroflexota bacterium]